MFGGEFNITLDDMGRISLPRRLREVWGEEAVLTRHKDGCLRLYTTERWQKIVEKELLNKTTQFSDNDVALRRSLSSTMVEIDKQGRITINPFQREHAGLIKDCFLVGQFEYYEIWDLERWKKCEAGLVEKAQAAAEILDARIKKDRELEYYGNSPRSGITGTDTALSGAEKQA
jgi:MraZ protein